jgi:ABC-2 type transport system permease protein
MNAVGNMSGSRLFAAYIGEMRIEFIKALRTPAFAVPTLLFPIMFYVLFGIFLGSMRGNSGQAAFTFATYGVFGAMGPGLFGFGVSLAIEREQGLLTLKQALPQPPGSYLLARAFMAMVFVSIISILLTLIAIFVGHVPLTFVQIVSLFAINVFGVLPFCAIGMFLGSVVSGQASPAVINIIFLPMAFLSGVILPLQMMPKIVSTIAPVWPAYHQAQMALATVGAPSAGSFYGHVAVLAGMTLLFFLLAVQRMHGSGFRLLGARPKRALAIISAGCVGVAALSMAGVFGGGPATKEDATAATDAASSSAGTPAPGFPIGKPAPGAVEIASFDSGATTAAYGLGWTAAGDDMRGGNSHATQQVITGGAGGSTGALEVTGEIGNGIQYPFAGTMFFPEGPPMKGLMDYSAKKTLSFKARGDGRRYILMVISGLAVDGIPLMQDFETGPEWREVKLDMPSYSNVDWKRVRAIGVGSMGPTGPFRFEIDDVRVE